MAEFRHSRPSDLAGDGLHEIRSLISNMFEIVDEQLADALNVILTSDRELAHKVRKRDDAVDDLEMQIDRMAERVLASRPETAETIRFVMAAIKVNTDLERIGDHCRTIAKSAVNIEAETLKDHARHFDAMIFSVRAMLYAAQDALLEGQLSKAWELVMDGHSIGRLHSETLNAIMESSQTKQSFEAGARLYALSKALERIADHSVNIAESVLFFEKGIDVRHARSDDKPQNRKISKPQNQLQ